jgi:hypothetical protein
MADFYARMAEVALTLIGRFGQTVTLQNNVAGEYDPSTGTVEGTTQEQQASAVLQDYTGQEFLTNTQIQQGDKKLKVAAKGLEWPPSLANKAIVQGTTYSVINVNEINPAGTPLVYELQVRS